MSALIPLGMVVGHAGELDFELPLGPIFVPAALKNQSLRIRPHFATLLSSSYRTRSRNLKERMQNPISLCPFPDS
jgi:hypothetical protein